MNYGHSELLPSVPTTAEEEAYGFILHKIRMGTFRAGDRLIPEDIATDIGTSRMPVRDAFRRLASEGLLLIRPNRGAVVRGLNVKEMEEVFNMRSVLEGLAARVASRSISEAQISELERLLDLMEQGESDVSEWITAHRNFHEYLCRMSASPRLIAQIEALHAVVEPHMRLWLEFAHKPMTSREDHMTVVHALRAGDPQLIEAAVREHIEATIPALKDWMVADVR